jgi:putative restriction endonuclease
MHVRATTTLDPTPDHMKSPQSTRAAFQRHLESGAIERSGKAKSYLRALDLLSQMLAHEPMGFADCIDIWNVTEVDRIHDLSKKVREEQQAGGESRWNLREIPPSYLQNGFCKAALREYELFLRAITHEESLLATFESYEGSEDGLAQELERELSLPLELEQELGGTEMVREVRTRTKQRVFRRMIRSLYQDQCCISGLDISELNRASHIVPWSENEAARLDPRNGLLLSATYDAAFDRHLITFDDTYRMVVSKEIRDHYTTPSVRELFARREGQRISLPRRYLPSVLYLEAHRARCDW